MDAQPLPSRVISQPEDDHHDDGIPTAAYTFISACAAVIVGVVVFQAAHHFLSDEL